MKHTTKNPLLVAVLTMVMAVPVLTSCESDTDSGVAEEMVSPDDDGVVLLDPTVEGEHTRGEYLKGSELTQYEIYTFYNGRARCSGCIATKEDGVWKKSKAITWPTGKAIDFYAMKPGFNFEGVKPTMNGTEKSITYTVPKENKDQVDFMFANWLQKKQADAKSGISLKFQHIFSYLRFAGKVGKAGLKVTVKSITIHNLLSTGKFTISDTKLTGGEWTMLDGYSDYRYELPTPAELGSTSVVIHPTTDMLFVLPQQPASIWKRSGVASDEDERDELDIADDNHQAYLEIECRIQTTQEMDDIPAGTYIPEETANENVWAHVYFPFSTSPNWINKRTYFAGTYNVTINFTGGYNRKGQDFLSANSGGGLVMTSLEQARSLITSEEWVEDTENSVTIQM